MTRPLTVTKHLGVTDRRQRGHVYCCYRAQLWILIVLRSECLHQSKGLLRHASGWPQRNKKQMLGKQTSPDPKPLSPYCLSSNRAVMRPIPSCAILLDCPPRVYLFPHFVILSLLSFYFLLLFSYSLSSLSYLDAFCTPSPSPPSLLLCHSAHLGCLVESGTSVPVRGAQWGPVEDTKGGLLQLPVTLRPTQQLFGVYTSVLNPHTQLYHNGTSLAPAQRSPLLTRLKQHCNQNHK